MKQLLFIILTSISTTFLNAQVSDTLYLFYELNADHLTSTEQQKLDSFLEENRKNVKSVHINTYCDTAASVNYNKALSNRRFMNLRLLFDTIPIASFNTFGEEIKNMKNYNASFSRRAEVIYILVDDEKVNPVSTTLPIRKKGNAFEEFMADPTVTKTTIRLSILFYTNVDTYYPEFEGELKQLYQFMSDNQNVTAHIRGHVCCGDDYTLSSNRAFKIYKYLKSNGIDPSRMSFKGYSNKIPEVYPEVTQYDELRNRRVDIIFTKEIQK